MKKNLWLAIILLPLSNVFGLTWTVNTVQTYTGNTFGYDEIVVQNGGILSLYNCTVNINQLGKIVVGTGGKLVLKNCNINVTSSSSIPNYWLGIQVLGNAQLTQTFANQGQLVLDNTTIQNALVGISVGNLKYTIDDQTLTNWHLNGGGIVNSTNSTIKNCRYAMVFNPYYNPAILQHPTANKSTFKGCTFIWDGNAQRDLCTTIEDNGTGVPVYLKTLVELNQVHDIIFSGCNFKSTRTFSNWFLNDHILEDHRFGYEELGLSRGKGIVSYGASFQILRGEPCGTTSSIIGSGCTNCTGFPCLFEGLSIGIHIDGFKNNNIDYPSYPTNNLEPYHEVIGAKFLNNRFGIVGYDKTNYVSSLIPINDQITTPLKKIFINRCSFEINDDLYTYHYEYEADFICLKNCGEVEISDNTFAINGTANASKPAVPSVWYSSCSSKTTSYIEFNNCNQGFSSIHRNSFYFSKFQQEGCRKYHNFNTFIGLNPDVEVTCNNYVSAQGMDFRYNEPNSCFCDLRDWDLRMNSFKTQLPNNKDAGNLWNDIPNSPQTNGLVYNIFADYLNATNQMINYNYDNSNSYKEPLTISDPNNKFSKNAVADVNSCEPSSYCKYASPRKYYDADGNGPIPIAATPIFPYVVFDFSQTPGSSSITVVLTPLEYIATSGLVTITKSDGTVIYSYMVSTDGHPVGFSFDFSSYPPGRYYITFTDASGKKYVVVITII